MQQPKENTKKRNSLVFYQIKTRALPKMLDRIQNTERRIRNETKQLVRETKN